MPTKTNDKPGCLKLLLQLFQSSSKEDQSAIVEILPYRLRDDFLSPAELSFYRVLLSVTGNRVVVFTKVRLADIFFVSRPNENKLFFNRISQRHVDFLLCQFDTATPIIGIELDDSSHNRSNRKERDEFVDKVFEVAKLPLIHIVAQRDYNTRELEIQIAPFLQGQGKEKEQQISSQITNQNNSVPICPKCGEPMVVRTVKRGEHQGKQFYGCPNYPQCREMLPVI